MASTSQLVHTMTCLTQRFAMLILKRISRQMVCFERHNQIKIFIILALRKETNRIDDRIVSIFQPHVRAIKRGKARNATEFGAKLSLSVVSGFSFLDRISWDNYNELPDFVAQVESYR